MTDQLIELVRTAAERTEAIVGALDASHRNAPTPCPELDAGAVVAHIIGGLRGFTDVAKGAELRFGGDAELGDDPAGELRSAVDGMLAAFDDEALDRTYSMPWGDTPGRQLVGFELIELLTHGWDVARSLGVQPDLPEEAAAAALDMSRQWVDESVRVPGMFGPEVVVPATASSTDRLVGFLGRDPGWSPQGSGS